jgi:hypothetical protein
MFSSSTSSVMPKKMLTRIHKDFQHAHGFEILTETSTTGKLGLIRAYKYPSKMKISKGDLVKEKSPLQVINTFKCLENSNLVRKVDKALQWVYMLDRNPNTPDIFSTFGLYQSQEERS